MNIQWAYVFVVWLELFAHAANSTRLTLHPYKTPWPDDEPLHVVCSAEAGDEAFSVSNLGFRFEKAGINQSQTMILNDSSVRVVNRTAIELRYAKLLELPENWDKRFQLYCYDRSKPTELSASLYVVLGAKPIKPDIFSSVVDNWDKLVFNWTGSLSETLYTAWYRNRNEADYHQCDKSEAFSCTVESPFGKSLRDELIIKVNASNDLGNSSSEKIISLHSIVRAGVVPMKAYVHNSSVIVVTFLAPKPKSMYYPLVVVCRNTTYVDKIIRPDDWLKIKNMEMHELVAGLPKYANCTVSMRARPSQPGGLYGPWTHVNLSTPEDVPLAAPRTCSSCFQVSMREKSIYRDLVLYFQPLSDEKARGSITQYRISLDHRIPIVRKIAASDRPFLTLSGNETLNDTGIEVNKSYNLILDARTKAGYNESLIHQTIRVPKHTDMLTKSHVNVVLINESTIFCWWRPIIGALKYTLFWCEEADGRLCVRSLNWIEFESDINEYYVQLAVGNSNHYTVGFAVESQNGKSSGIKWSQCQSNYKSVVVRPPSVSEHSRSGCCNITISISKPDCQLADGYIVSYRVYHKIRDQNPGEAWIMTSVSSMGHERLVSLEDLKPETEYVVSVRSVSAPGFLSATNVTIQLERTGSLGLGVTFIVLVTVGSLILAVLLVAVICSLYRKLFRWLSIGISLPPTTTSKSLSCPSMNTNVLPVLSRSSVEEPKSPVVMSQRAIEVSESSAPLLSTMESESIAPLPLVSVLDSDWRLQPAMDAVLMAQKPESYDPLPLVAETDPDIHLHQSTEPASGISLPWTPEPVIQEITQPTVSRLLPAIESEPVEHWSSIEMNILPDISWPPPSQCDESLGNAAKCSSASSAFGYAPGGECHYKSPFSPIPKTNPSEVRMDGFFDPSANSVVCGPCVVLPDDKKVLTGDTSPFKQRLLPLTCLLPDERLVNETTSINGQGCANGNHVYDDSDDDELVSANRRYNTYNEPRSSDMDSYSKGTEVFNPLTDKW